MVVQGLEEKYSFGFVNFLSGYPTSVEVQGLLVLLELQGHTEVVWPFMCRRLVALSRT